MKPFAILLGGKHPKALVELHDVTFTMAVDHEEAFRNVADRWFGDLKTAHVDAWLDLTIVDGHRFTVGKNPSGKSLFFVNIGSYQINNFGEDHRYRFLICENKAEAKARALKQASRDSILVHTDNLAAVESLIKIAKVEGIRMGWEVVPDAKAPVAINGYFPLKKYRLGSKRG